MTEDHFIVYQFMATRFGGVAYDTFKAFQQGVASGDASKRFLPSKTWGMYNIDTNELLAEGYLCRYGFDLVKVKNGKVSEYYRRLLSNKDHCFVAYDVDTLKVVETYRNVDNRLNKYDWPSGELKQSNNNCNYEMLPEDFKAAISSFAYKNNVFMYAIKPYGRVVEFYYPRK